VSALRLYDQIAPKNKWEVLALHAILNGKVYTHEETREQRLGNEETLEEGLRRESGPPQLLKAAACLLLELVHIYRGYALLLLDRAPCARRRSLDAIYRGYALC